MRMMSSTKVRSLKVNQVARDHLFRCEDDANVALVIRVVTSFVEVATTLTTRFSLGNCTSETVQLSNFSAARHLFSEGLGKSPGTVS